ncbi:MAG: site-specific integrase [archaeon]
MNNEINNLTRILKGYSYDQTSYIISKVRKNLGLKKIQKKTVVQPLSSEDLGRILTTAYNNKSTKGLMIQTMFCLGLRVSELVNLKIEHFDYNGKRMYIDVAKKDSQRTVPVLSDLANLLKIHIGERKSGFIFQSQKPNMLGHYRYSTARIWQIVKEAGIASGVETEHKKIYPHKLRHTVATFLKSKGMPIDEIQKFLGHTNISTTQIYAKTDISSLEASYYNAFGVKKKEVKLN